MSTRRAGGEVTSTRVYIEEGRRWTFACALDWPGWCRRGRGEEEALASLLVYQERYAAVAGPEFRPGSWEVIGRVSGTATTDFGAPDAVGEWDRESLSSGEARRLAGLLTAVWAALDAVVAGAPAELRKGPRGGGRDRDAIADHVREAERSYGRKLGVAVPSGTPWAEHRQMLVGALVNGDAQSAWPRRYAVRRLAWHVLDHAWEIEDRSGA
ncbi:MAG: hypothetical protein M3010_12960 [Candidatus Dormibacteraeota bacterium]|nr:hypothetical protein [Candidatus Dormibacteraeota bacterium]